MADRPILFSAPMVRALLNGQKTQTRRLVKPQPPAECTHLGPVIGTYSGAAVPRFYWKTAEDYEAAEASGVEYVFWPAAHDEESDGFTGDVYSAGGLLCPYGSEANCMKLGDRLWVRESWSPDPPCDGTWGYTAWAGCRDGRIAGVPERFRHPAFCNYAANWLHGPIRWTPSIHMPRWASRITLNITGVRVERLQAISEDDARAEGVERIDTVFGMRLVTPHWRAYGNEETQTCMTAAASFRTLWSSINGAESWDANPWVWVVEFERAES